MKRITDKEQYMMIVFLILMLVAIAVLLGGCAKGDTGAPGAAGAPGSSPILSVLPASPAVCPNGGYTLLITNPDGSQQTAEACNGIQGQQGPQGNPGQDATPVTVVQFCQGVTPAYPSSFPEYGICLDNQLYGIYSANGGFLALLPPGTYSSDGINASCTFTIAQNCQVSQ